MGDLTTYVNVSYNSFVSGEQETKLFYTTKELGQLAGVSPDYIRQLLLAGKLEGQKMGRDWAIPASEVQRYLTERSKH